MSTVESTYPSVLPSVSIAADSTDWIADKP